MKHTCAECGKRQRQTHAVVWPADGTLQLLRVCKACWIRLDYGTFLYTHGNTGRFEDYIVQGAKVLLVSRGDPPPS